jgi:hypothetical protein
MQWGALSRGCLVALAGAVALAACGDGPTRPSGGGNPPPPAPTLIRIEVGGPATVAPGETAPFTATGHYSDNSTQNLTSQPGISWQSTNTRVLAIAQTGVATAGERGEASIMARFANRSAAKGVLVLPSGTYRLAGTVTDTGVPIMGARVEVTHGPATGLVAIASPYRLYGVSGDTEILVTRDGYKDERRRVQVDSHQTANFELTLSAPRENVEGTYTLTVTANQDCRVVLPEQARVRTYTAVLKQQGPRVTVTLEGPEFYSDGRRVYNSFSGTLEGDRLSFVLAEPYYSFYYFPDVMEVFASSPTVYLYLAGTVTTGRSGSGRSGPLSGSIVTVQPLRFTTLASCSSGSHGFELLRR